MARSLPEDRRRLALVAISALSMALVVIVTHTHHDRAHYTGDDVSSVHTRTAAENFARNGFLRMRLAPATAMPVTVPDDARDLEGIPVYTHYPSGSELFYGALYGLGVRSEVAERLVATLISFVGAFFWFLAFKGLWPASRPPARTVSWAAVSAWVVLVSSPAFVFFADALHQFPWFFLFFGVFLVRIVEYGDELIHIDAPLPPELLRLAALGLVASWFSFDLLPALAALGLAYPLLAGRRELWRGVVLALGVPAGMAVGFGLHLLRNAWVFGSLGAAVDDLAQAFLLRTSITPDAREIFQYSFVKHLAKNLVGLLWFVTLPVACLSLWGWARAFKSELARHWRALGVATLVSALAWQVLMPQHAMIHSFTYRHGLLFWVLGFGAFAWSARGELERGLVVFALGFLVLHTTLGVFQIEGTAFKRAAVHELLADHERAAWACDQRQWLFHSTETPGAQAVVRELLPADCGSALSTTGGFRGRLAQLVLYLR